MIKDADAWELYTKIKEQHELTGIFDKTDKCHRFYIGDQWRGCETGNEKLPVINIIKPIVDHKVATVAQNKLTITLNPLNAGSDYVSAKKISDKLTEHMALMWELHKMDRLLWLVAKDAAICGDAYVLFYDGQGDSQLIDRTQIFLSDEQEKDIQTQKYIIIKERRHVSEIKAEAKKNGVDKVLIDSIIADSDTDRELGEDSDKEVKGDISSKTTSVLMLWKDENGIVHRSRSCQYCVYEPDASTGLERYPIASLIWLNKKGSARGIGEVEPIIDNQIEINKQVARMIMTSKLTSYPKIAYRRGAISNPEQLEKAGGVIEVDDISVSAITDMVTYLHPSGMSADVYNIWTTLENKTKELAGASDAALGQIDPSKASGTAIIAVKSQSALPLNDQMAAYKQFVEDIALIWWDLWATYNPDGMRITITNDKGELVNEMVTAETLKAIKIKTRIDVSPDSPFDRYAQEQSVERALVSGYISFEEYVASLDSNSTAPRALFEKVLREREKKAQAQAGQQALMQAMAQAQGGQSIPADMGQGIPPEQNTGQTMPIM